MIDDEPDGRTYAVVYNDEKQYSIWWADRAMPAGWYPDGMSGTRAECLTHIDKVWTDMRPLSLRNQMDRDRAQAVEVVDGGAIERT